MDKKNNMKIMGEVKMAEIPNPIQSTRKASGYEFVSYGKDNLFPQYLYEVYRNSSSKHSALINRKSGMVGGYGINEEDLSDEQMKFIKNKFSNLSLDDIVRMVSYDLEVLYHYYLEIIYTNDKNSIASINYIPASKIRLGVINETNPRRHFLYSKDWTNIKKEDNRPVYYEPFSAGMAGNNKELLFVPLYQGYNEFYPTVGYQAALEYIEIDRQIAVYHNSELTNGFSGGYMVNFTNGIPTEDEMREFDRDFKKNNTGSMNAGKVVITYSEDKDTAPILTPLPSNDSADRFKALEENVLQNILIAHEVVNPELFGIAIPGKLGSSNIHESLDIFQSVYVDQRQKLIQDSLDTLFEYVSKEKDFVKFKLNKFKINTDTHEK